MSSNQQNMTNRFILNQEWYGNVLLMHACSHNIAHS